MTTVFIVFYFFLLFVVALYGFNMYWLIFIYLKNRDKQPVQTRNNNPIEYPPVTVQLPIFNERRVAIRLIEAIKKFNWPGDKLQIQILDDSTDETTEQITDYLIKEDFGSISIEHIRRGNREGFKAGALAFGLKKSKAEFVTVFDADNLPRPDFLIKNIPYFENFEIGMVQTRWSFLNQNESFLCRSQALFLNAHFIIEQQARSLGGLLFNFNGTAGIWRRQAIDEAGGWQHDTLTEDLDLSYRAQLTGWKFYFNSDYDVPTELPNNINGFKSQQYRWSKGAVQTAIKLLPTIIKTDIPFRQKLAATFHLTSKFLNVTLMVLTLMLIPALYIRMEGGMLKLLLIDLPIFIGATASVSLFYSLAYKAAKTEKNLKDIFTLPLLTSLGIALAVNNTKAVLSALLGRTTPFIRTPKSGSTDKEIRLIPRAYRRKSDRTIFTEAALAIYSLAAIFLAFKMNLYFAVPFLVTFCAGYCYFVGKGVSDAVRS